ncbi:MAG: diguanylate cyclase domain-containing protein [Bacillota bacterium]
MEIENKNQLDIDNLNQDSNKLLAKFITTTTFTGSIVNFISRTIFTDQSKIEIITLSIFLIILGIISNKLSKSDYNKRVVTHMLSTILFFIVVSLILLFRYNGGVTIWAISLLCLIIGVVGTNKTAIIYNSAATFLVGIYLWIYQPKMYALVDPSDYLTRIGIYLIALRMVYIVNDMLVTRMKKNIEHVENIKEKNNEIINLHQEIHTLVSESTNDGIWRYDLRNNKQIYSQWWVKKLGYTEKEIINKGDWFSLVHEDDLDSIQNDYNNYLEHEIDYYENECRMITKTGDQLWIKVKIKGLFDKDGAPYMIVGAYTDITSLKEKNAKLEKLAFYDSLTGLPNRKYFLDELKSSLEIANKKQTKLYVVFIDLDNFKKVNDSLGHYYGDILLEEVSNRFNQIVQQPCFLGRLGGDEFAIIIQGITETKQIENYVQQLMNSLRNPIILKDTRYNISASFGVAIFPEDGTNINELLKNADKAMYKAKEAGKNNFKIFRESM